MKTLPLCLVSLLLGVRLLGAGPDDPVAQTKFSWADPSDPAVTAIRQAGEDAIQLIGNKLVSEVNQVLPSKGAEDAIDVLHLKTLTLPRAGAGKPAITAVKRTSLKVRSPANMPDSADLAALMSIEKELMDGNNPPKVLVQHIEASGSMPEEWRVYRPIGVTSACIVCHGPVDSLLPSVKAKLQRLFPADKAVDYAAYDWRGVIRVSVTPAPAKKTSP